MHVFVGGYEADNPDDPMVIVGSISDQPVVPGPISKERREDWQVFAFLHALTLTGSGHHPFKVEPGGNPPDRLLEGPNGRWGVELTELTFKDVREDLAPVRAFGRRLQERLFSEPDTYGHLNGRLVTLSMIREGTTIQEPDVLLAELAELLAEDHGFMGQGMDLSAGLPEQLGEAGRLGEHGPFVVTVQGQGSGPVVVSASVNARVKLSQMLDALADRIKDKDVQGNDVLVISLGFPDQRGYRCPADLGLAKLLYEAADEGRKVINVEPTHIRGIAIQLWSNARLLLWGQGPWSG